PADMIWPNVGDTKVRSQAFRLVQLITLNNSALNVSRPLSPEREKLLLTEMSLVRKPGPTTEFRAAVPNIPAAGVENAAVLKYSSSFALRERLVDGTGLPTTFGLSLSPFVRLPPIKAVS